MKKPCVICGSPFDAIRNINTCSEACRRERYLQVKRDLNKKHQHKYPRDRREYQREYWRKRRATDG